MRPFFGIALSALMLVSCSKTGEARDEPVREIAWSGTSLENASYWVNGKPIGRGLPAYTRLKKEILRKNPDESHLVVSASFKDLTTLIDKYGRQDSLPFADDLDELVLFNTLLAEKRMSLEPRGMKTLDGLPAQSK